MRRARRTRREEEEERMRRFWTVLVGLWNVCSPFRASGERRGPLGLSGDWCGSGSGAVRWPHTQLEQSPGNPRDPHPFLLSLPRPLGTQPHPPRHEQSSWSIVDHRRSSIVDRRRSSIVDRRRLSSIVVNRRRGSSWIVDRRRSSSNVDRRGRSSIVSCRRSSSVVDRRRSSSVDIDRRSS